MKMNEPPDASRRSRTRRRSSRVTSARHRRTRPRCWPCSAYASRAALIDAVVPAGHSRACAAAAAGGDARGGGAREARGDRRRQPRAEVVHRPGLLRHAHAGRHPAQHPRESRVVHRVHAVSARDRARPARGARQFPDDGVRPDRHGDRQCVDAGRSHRRGGGDGARVARRQEREPALLRRGRCFPQTLDVVRTRAQPLGLTRRAGPAERCASPPTRSRCCCSIPAATATCAITVRWRPTLHAQDAR